MRLERAWTAVAAFLLVLGVGACEPAYEGISLRRVGGNLAAEIDGREVSVPEGTLLIFEPELEARRGKYDALDEVAFEVLDGDVAQVIPGLRAGTWMLLGATEGRTEVDVLVNGEHEDSLVVRVTGPEVSP